MDRFNALTEWRDDLGIVSEQVATRLKYLHVFGRSDTKTMGAFMVTEDHDVYAVGYNGEWGLLCAPLHVRRVFPEARIRALSRIRVTRISVGEQVGAAITEYGVIYFWGRDLSVPWKTAQVMGVHQPYGTTYSTYVQVECGSAFVAALTSSGTVHLWGFMYPTSEMMRVYRVSTCPIQSFACGLYHIAMLSTGGEVFTCGYASNGQLGREWSRSERFLVAELVDLEDRCIQVACGKQSTLFLLEGGSLYATGMNDDTGYLGVQDEYDVDYPERVQINQPVMEIVASITGDKSYFAAVTVEGLIFWWGDNKFPSKVHDETELISAFYGVAIPSSLGEVCLCQDCRKETNDLYPEY